MSDMTRTEAIRLLQATRLMLLGKDNQPISDLYYALEMAINSLKIDEMYDLTMEDPDAYIHRLVIEDIKAAIRQSACDQKIKLVAIGMEKALEIIDKHTGDES